MTAADDAHPARDDPPRRGRSRLSQKLPWLGLALLCLVADLVTKWLVFYPTAERPEFSKVADVTLFGEPLSWFAIVIAYNRGVTFGLASGTSVWLLALGTSAVIALLFWQLWVARPDERAKCFALSIIIGGAVGNLYDRTLRPIVEPDKTEGVRDFLDWYAPDHWALARWLREHVGTTHWYTSNVADVLIVCGVILLAWLIITEKPPQAPASDGSPTREANA